MQSPLQIHFPPLLCGNLKTSNEFPAGYGHKIPFAKPSLTICDLGDFLVQAMHGDDYWIELRSFSVRQDGYLDFVVSKSCISIAMFLKGHLTCRLMGNVMANLTAKTYNVFYFPVGKQTINLTKGDYTWFCIIPPQYYLKSMAVEHSSFKSMSSRLEDNKEEGAFLTSLSLPYGIFKIIKRLQKTNKHGSALDIDLRRYMLEILNLYNEQYTRNKSQPYPYSTTKEKAIAVREYILSNLGDVNLGGLNELAFVTTKPLTKEFKILTGKTIPQFITDERMQWAKHLLDKKEMRVFEIALLTGFSDASNFTRKFKKKFGYAPGG